MTSEGGCKSIKFQARKFVSCNFKMYFYKNATLTLTLTSVNLRINCSSLYFEKIRKDLSRLFCGISLVS